MEGLSPALPSLCCVSPCGTRLGAGKDRVVPGRATSAPGRCCCCSFMIGHAAAGMGTSPDGPRADSCGCPRGFRGLKHWERRQRTVPRARPGDLQGALPCPRFSQGTKGDCNALHEVVPQQEACKKPCIPWVFLVAAAAWWEPCESCRQRITCTPVVAWGHRPAPDLWFR